MFTLASWIHYFRINYQNGNNKKKTKNVRLGEKVSWAEIKTDETRQVNTAHGHMMPLLLHVCNGLARHANKSVLAQDIGTQ